MSEALQASNLKSLRFQRSFFFVFFVFARIVEEIKKSRHVRSKLPIIMQRLTIGLCCKFGIHRVNRNNKKLAFSSCSTQQNITMLIYSNKKTLQIKHKFE